MSIDRARNLKIDTHKIRQLEESALGPVDAEHLLEVGIEDVKELRYAVSVSTRRTLHRVGMKKTYAVCKTPSEEQGRH